MRQKAIKTLIVAVLAFVALGLTCAFVFGVRPARGVAFADEESLGYIKANVSNLEDNEFAQAGTVAICEKNGAREFLIPESYYVLVIDKILNSFYRVKYFGQEFYIDINSHTALVPSADAFDEGETYYPEVELTLAEGVELSSLEGVDSSLKKLDPTYTINFLGYAADPETPDLVYIMATSEDGATLLGFIPKSAFEAFDVPYQARAQREREELLAQKEQLKPAPGPGDLPAPEGSLALKIVLIIGICVPAVLIVILLFVPSRKNDSLRKTRGSSHDGTDYDNPAGDDRQRNNSARGYDANYPQNYPSQNYPQNPQGYPPQNYPQNNQGYPPQYGGGYQGGYDPRMEREVRGYDPNDRR